MNWYTVQWADRAPAVVQSRLNEVAFRLKHKGKIVKLYACTLRGEAEGKKNAMIHELHDRQRLERKRQEMGQPSLDPGVLDVPVFAATSIEDVLESKRNQRLSLIGAMLKNIQAVQDVARDPRLRRIIREIVDVALEETLGTLD